MARFDGVDLTPFNQNNLPVMPDSGVLAFAQDADGVFWVGTDKGLLRCRNDTWTRFDANVTAAIVALLCEPNGPTWAATGTQVYQIHGDKLVPFPTQGISLGAIRGLVRCTNGDIVVHGSPIAIIRGNQVLPCGRAQGISDDNSTAVAADSEGGAWIGTSRGLHYYNNGAIASFSTKDGLPVNAIRSLLVDRDKNLWIGTARGLTRRTNGKFEDLIVRGDERVSHVLSLFEDRERNVWLGTDTGFARLTDIAFSHITQRQGLLSSSTVCILHAKDGSTWVSLYGGGITHLSSQGAKSLLPGQGLRDDTVVSMKEDTLGGLWLGYFTRGLTYYRDGKFSHYFDRQRAEIDNWAVDIDPGGRVWAVNTFAGLMRFDGTDFERVPCPGLVRPQAVASDRKETIWVAGANGAGRLQQGQWRFMPKPAASRSNRPIAIIVDPENGVWVLYDMGEIHRYTESGASLIAFDLAEVGPLSYGGTILQGELWISFRFGLLHVPVAQLTAVIEGRRQSPAYVLYNETWGMKSAAPNVAGNPSVSVDQEGRIWAATSRSVAIIDPKKLPFNAQPPTAVIEHVLTDKIDRPLDQLERIPPGRGELAFKFTAPSLTESTRNRFKYRLLGFEDAWSKPTPSREAFYGGLPPGRYRFEVLASNNDGVWSPRPTALDLRILPFFYERIEVQILGGVLLIAGVLGLVRWRLLAAHRRARALQEQNIVLEKRIAERTAELAGSYEALRASQRELFEASRMVGIAEMATGVLHNIGNALNSVKTSSGVAADAIHQIKPAGVAKVQLLLQEQGERVGEFLLRDPRGRQVPDYLGKVAGQIDEQKKRAQDELGALERAVEDVARIVADQQSLAQTSGVAEAVAPAELVESALRLTDAFLTRSLIKVQRELLPAPSVHVDRQKALQILVCLVRNAIVALGAVDEPARLITVGVRSPEPDRVTIYVSDAGLGIVPENLIRIFAMDFAKMPVDYGFGLHNSALMAKEIGGTLTVESGGTGRGATFELKLPVGRTDGRDAPG